MEKMESLVELNQRCAQLLKAARKKRRLTQTQLAERLGCQQPMVAKIERCARRLNVAEFIQVAQAIGVDAGKIIRKLAAKPAPNESSRCDQLRNVGRA